MATLGDYAIAVFLALHGLVHFWYVALSRGWVDVEEAMGWSGRSWLLSGVLGETTVLDVASVLYVLVAVGFVVGALGYVLGGGWGAPVLVGSAVLSTVVLVAMWDGQFAKLVEKGVLGVLINLVVLTWLLVLE